MGQGTPPQSASRVQAPPPVGQVWSPWSKRVVVTRELADLILKSGRSFSVMHAKLHEVLETEYDQALIHRRDIAEI